MSLIGNRLYIDIPKIAEKHRKPVFTLSSSSSACGFVFFLVLLFFPSPPCSFSCCFPLEQIHGATGVGCHLPKKPHIKQIVWQAFYETTQQGVGDGSGLLKRNFPLLSLIHLSLTRRRQFILAISPCGPGITPSSAVLKA